MVVSFADRNLGSTLADVRLNRLTKGGMCVQI
jgi:hypothetical protein